MAFEAAVMVSPRKKVLQAAHNSKSATKTKQIKYPAAFGKYRFYLDVRSSKSKGALIEDIKSLGGALEEFLSKEITHVISDSPEVKFPPASPAGAGAAAGPPSPWTPTPTPSPATSTSLEGVDRNKRSGVQPKSRVEAILEAAKQPARSGGSSDVLENARRWNCQIWSLEKTLKWLERFKNKYGELRPKSRPPHGRDSSPSLAVVTSQRLLTPPCIKLENVARLNKPVFAELKAWPTIYYDGKPGTSPFSVPSSKEKTKKLAKRLDIHRDVLKKAKKPSPPKVLTKKRQSGFCEICNKSYTDLEEHLGSEGHTQFVNNSYNWREVDECYKEWVFPLNQ